MIQATTILTRAGRWIKTRREPLINVYLAINVLGVIFWQSVSLYQQNRLDVVEITFILNNLVLAWMLLIRRPPRWLDHSSWHQMIALIAFFSGIAFIEPSATDDPKLVFAAQSIMLIASLLGLITLFNLGRNFGILIACRGVETGGLYQWVRHPMYATDILLRIGYLMTHCTMQTFLLFVLSSACYVYRAVLEERFLLAHTEDYRNYFAKVPYRFVPGLF